MTVTRIEAQAVEAGDRIYNRHAYCRDAAWVRVTSVEPHANGYVCIRTIVYDTWLYGREGVTVQRKGQR